MKNQIKALDTAKDNCEDGANMIQTAEGYMKETHDILTRMTELAEKAANGLLEDEDRTALQNEMDQLCGEIDRMATTANFNGRKLLDGSIGSNGTVEISSDATGNHYKVSTNAPSTGGLVGSYTPSGDAVASLEGSAKEALTAKVVAAAEGLATGAGSVKVAVNRNGDVVTGSGAERLAGSSGTDIYNSSSNKDGYSLVTVTITESTSDAATVNEGIKLQIGESSTAADKMKVEIGSFHTDTLLGGINGFQNKTAGATGETDAAAVAATKTNESATYDKGITVDISDQNKASAAADAIRQVSNYVSDQRGKLGAQQNRLDHTVNNLATASENTTAAKSRILDTDMAKEMMEYTSKNVIAQAAQSMLAQANSQPQNVLSLLQ
jgi:flagellin